jgi:hypothetical protein
MRDRPFAQQLLRPAVSEFRSSDLVLMYRLMRVSRRCRLEIDHEFVTRCREGISTAQTRHPEFAAVAALELAYWLYLNDNGRLAAELLAEAMSVASKAEYRFQGRHLTLSQSLNHKLGAERRRLSPELPLELPQHLLLDRREGKIVALSSTEPKPPVDWDQLVRATLPRNLMLIVPDNLAGELLEANLNRSRPHGFRRAPAQGSDRHEAVASWFQSALFDAGYPIELTGRWSASDQTQLARFALERNIRRAKWIEWPAKQQLRIASKRPAKVLLICESFESERSHRQGYGAAGLDFLKETGLKNCRVWRVGDEPIHKINEPFDLVWITGFFEESSSGLALIMRERSNTLAFTPDQISRIINNRGPRPDLQPLVFLDAPDNPDRHRQARLRNQFAHSLYSLGAARSVLAAGLVEKNLQLYLLDLRHCLEKHASEGETAKKLS